MDYIDVFDGTNLSACICFRQIVKVDSCALGCLFGSSQLDNDQKSDRSIDPLKTWVM